ncbi:MAG: efflux RND transporter periplasmic adaptor subunit [Synechococcales cyanobacterium T60_A2020_003]|nr:efflux RND transporter periplasmic adaptor subunit [Synechococcales cyanobacterium T60_A2020_003]
MSQTVSSAPQGTTDESKGGSLSAPQKRSPLKKLRLLIPLGLLVVGVGWGIRAWLYHPDDHALRLSGRIEGYETDLAAKSGGRIESVAVREGDRVQSGQVIARLDDDELQAEYAAAQASVAAAQQQVRQAQSQIAVVQSQIEEAQLVLQQSEGDTVGRVSQAEATVATAQAQLAEAQAQVQQAQSELELARLDRDRLRSLLNDGAIAQQQFDQAQTRYETAQGTLEARQAGVTAAERQVRAAEGGLTQAETTQLNPDIRVAQIARLQTQLDQANAQLAAAQAEEKRAIANQAEVAARLANLEIVSPIDGVVVTRMVEPGEVISMGTTVMTVVNLEDVYLRGYIPEGEVGNVRVGQDAQVFLDSAPDQPLAATVIAIDTEASFTPENIYFQNDRVTQVFGLRLDIENPEGFAKPGMPADGEILLSGEQGDEG